MHRGAGRDSLCLSALLVNLPMFNLITVERVSSSQL